MRSSIISQTAYRNFLSIFSQSSQASLRSTKPPQLQLGSTRQSRNFKSSCFGTPLVAKILIYSILSSTLLYNYGANFRSGWPYIGKSRPMNLIGSNLVDLDFQTLISRPYVAKSCFASSIISKGSRSSATANNISSANPTSQYFYDNIFNNGSIARTNRNIESGSP